VNWHEDWVGAFGSAPVDPTSREVSVQEVLAELIAGQPCRWFEHYEPTERGKAFLRGLSEAAFGGANEQVAWFVSEYALPVPPAWRNDIPFTYRCPDFACGDVARVLIVELKTERGSYQPRQMVDYLRLARHTFPDCWTDVVLLGPHRPGARPPHDDRQRYAELTWADVPARLLEHFGDDPRATQLCAFLHAELARPTAAATGTPARIPEDGDRDIDEAARGDAAVAHALRLAPSVATATASDRTERGIDVVFPTIESARRARRRVAAALQDGGWTDRVSVWLWQPASSGKPTTDAGAVAGLELRLAPRLARPHRGGAT
jgi:hypothetical protein